MARWPRAIQPTALSCPACLGDLVISQAHGGWTYTCTGCGILITREPAERVAAPV